MLRQAMHVAPWQVAATLLCVASLAASTASLTRYLRADAAASANSPNRVAGPAASTVASAPASLVSVAPVNGHLLIVFPRSSSRSSIRIERHEEPFAAFGAAHIDQTPLIILPGELRVQELPATGADFELRIPESVTQVHVRIGAQTMARWSGSPLTWDYGRPIPLRLPVPG